MFPPCIILDPWGIKRSFFSFLCVVMLHVELNGNEAENTMQVNIRSFYTPAVPRRGQRSKQYFSEVGYDIYYIKLKGKTCRTLCKFDLMHIPDWSDIELCR